MLPLPNVPRANIASLWPHHSLEMTVSWLDSLFYWKVSRRWQGDTLSLSSEFVQGLVFIRYIDQLTVASLLKQTNKHTNNRKLGTGVRELAQWLRV